MGRFGAMAPRSDDPVNDFFEAKRRLEAAAGNCQAAIDGRLDEQDVRRETAPLIRAALACLERDLSHRRQLNEDPS
jgi:hypothetical protein